MHVSLSRTLTVLYHQSDSSAFQCGYIFFGAPTFSPPILSTSTSDSHFTNKKKPTTKRRMANLSHATFGFTCTVKVEGEKTTTTKCIKWWFYISFHVAHKKNTKQNVENITKSFYAWPWLKNWDIDQCKMRQSTMETDFK